MKIKIHFLCKLIVLVMIVRVAVATADPDVPKGIIVLDGKPAPALKLKNMDGEPFDLADVRGRWAFVHFWASWCGPCRKEMPTIQAMAKQLSDNQLSDTQLSNEGLEIVMVNTAETDDTVFSFMGIVAPDLTPLLDYDGLVTEAWQPRGLPSTFLVDPQGQLRYLALGGRPWNKPQYIQFLERIITQNNSP
ncbi:MAG: TlpA disulfide reductase family protein [Gammaproteobacteria bacterium]|jgi:thiol-disulfide isomerase/thioredoxin